VGTVTVLLPLLNGKLKVPGVPLKDITQVPETFEPRDREAVKFVNFAFDLCEEALTGSFGLLADNLVTTVVPSTTINNNRSLFMWVWVLDLGIVQFSN
jgi:hypothetical protein